MTGDKADVSLSLPFQKGENDKNGRTPNARGTGPEADTHVKSSISRPVRRSSISGPRDSSASTLPSSSLPCTTLGHWSPPRPSIPFDSPPQAHSPSVSVRERIGPPPPSLLTRRASYASVEAGADEVGWGSSRSRLKPAYGAVWRVRAAASQVRSPQGSSLRNDATSVPLDEAYARSGSVMFVLHTDTWDEIGGGRGKEGGSFSA